jgi:hypothetical protein
MCSTILCPSFWNVKPMMDNFGFTPDRVRPINMWIVSWIIGLPSIAIGLRILTKGDL